MDFWPSDEQRMLQDTARRYLATRYPAARVAELADSPGGWDPDSWRELESMGWLDAAASPVDAMLLAEELGHALYPGPWLTTAALAGPAFAAAGLALAGPATLAWIDEKAHAILDAAATVSCCAKPIGDGWRLTGLKLSVPDAERADAVVVVADPGIGGTTALFLVDLRAWGDVLRPRSTVDSLRPLADLEFDDTPAELLFGPEHTGVVLRATWRHALTLLAGEAVGVARWALDTAVQHARTRTQFGRPIGAFQAVAHPLADVYAATEFARSLAYRAAGCVADNTADVDEAVRTAAVSTRQAALLATEAAMQALGAIGFSWEHPLHRWYKRALWINGFDSPLRQLRAGIAAALLEVH